MQWKEVFERFKEETGSSAFATNLFCDWLENNYPLQPSPGLREVIEVEDLQKQVRDHIKAHDLFDWHEALTENEMILLENLLLTFAPMFSPGSVGFEKTIRPYLKSQPTDEPDAGYSEQTEDFKEYAVRFMEWLLKDRLFFVDEVRKWLRQYDKEEISFSKFVELFNEKVFNKYHSQLKQTPAKDEDEK